MCASPVRAPERVGTAGVRAPRPQRSWRRLKLLAAGAVVVPAAVVAVAWAVFFTPDSPPELRLSTQPGGATVPTLTVESDPMLEFQVFFDHESTPPTAADPGQP